jgi:hypothetical protein
MKASAPPLHVQSLQGFEHRNHAATTAQGVEFCLPGTMQGFGGLAAAASAWNDPEAAGPETREGEDLCLVSRAERDSHALCLGEVHRTDVHSIQVVHEFFFAHGQQTHAPALVEKTEQVEGRSMPEAVDGVPRPSKVFPAPSALPENH